MKIKKKIIVSQSIICCLDGEEWIERPDKKISQTDWGSADLLCINCSRNHSEEDHMAMNSRSQTWRRIHGLRQSCEKRNPIHMTAITEGATELLAAKPVIFTESKLWHVGLLDMAKTPQAPTRYPQTPEEKSAYSERMGCVDGFFSDY